MRITQLAFYGKAFGGSTGGGGGGNEDDGLEWSQYSVSGVEYDFNPPLPSGTYKIKVVAMDNGAVHEGSFVFENRESWQTISVTLDSGLNIDVIHFYIEGIPGEPPDANYLKFEFVSVGSVSTLYLAKIE